MHQDGEVAASVSPPLLCVQDHDVWSPVTAAEERHLELLSSRRLVPAFAMLTCRMLQEPYREHYHEAGFNALFFIGAAHSWARDIRIVNADYGIGLEHAHFCTVGGRRAHDGLQARHHVNRCVFISDLAA